MRPAPAFGSKAAALAALFFCLFHAVLPYGNSV
jgi:hypothetical protein